MLFTLRILTGVAMLSVCLGCSGNRDEPGTNNTSQNNASIEVTTAGTVENGATAGAARELTNSSQKSTSEDVHSLSYCMNDTSRQGSQRRKCMFEFIRTTVSTGIPFEKLVELKDKGEWFTSNTVFDVTEASKLPVARSFDTSVFLLKPNLPEGNNSGVYFRLSKPIDKQSLLGLARREITDTDLKIIEVAFVESE